MQSNNKVVISAAGSGKTTYIVEQAIKNSNNKVLILTYTIENFKQIKKYIIDRVGLNSENIKVQTWFSFLLQECVRPYQNYIYDTRRIDSIFFVQGRSVKYTPKNKIGKYFFSEGNKIYTDKIAEFACLCDSESAGYVIERLGDIYDCIYIDETQDLSGYDFDFLKLLLESNIALTLVGDSRQATYFTNCSQRNKQFKGQNIVNLFECWKKEGLCEIEERNDCFRCNQKICNLADKLYPSMPKTISNNFIITGHDGVFIIKISDLKSYIEKYSPVILRDRITTKTAGFLAINFGVSKGQSFDRVLIFPNGPIRDFLKDGDSNKLKPKTKANLYVGITRARYSLTFVYDDSDCIHDAIQIL